MSESLTPLKEFIARIPDFDEEAANAARSRQDQLTKPQGSLGELEALSIQIAGITGRARPKVGPATIIVAAGSHGVSSEGVSAFPPEVTAQMVTNFLHGNAAINVLARNAGAEVVVVDAGVGSGCPSHENLHQMGFGFGTANFTQQPAMDLDHAKTIIERGANFVKTLHQKGTRMICLGDMGIGNTTAASAIAAVVTGAKPDITTGRGTMIDDATLNQKIRVIEQGIAKHQPAPDEALGLLSAFGGYETGFLCGCLLGAARSRIPTILDGYPTTAAALLAELLSPGVKDFMIAGHQSVEPGHCVMLDHLGKTPLVNLSMRLGEGSGAAVAIPIVNAAIRCLDEMSTFEEAAVASAIS